MACRNAGTVSVIGVYGGFIDEFPAGSFMNRSMTMKTGQGHVQRCGNKLLERVEPGEIDPSFVITHPTGTWRGRAGLPRFPEKR